VTARPAACAHCQAAFTDADQVLHGRYDKIDLPVVHPMVTRVERYAGAVDAAAASPWPRVRGAAIGGGWITR
jgi:hypothetical protein